MTETDAIRMVSATLKPYVLTIQRNAPGTELQFVVTLEYGTTKYRASRAFLSDALVDCLKSAGFVLQRRADFLPGHMVWERRKIY